MPWAAGLLVLAIAAALLPIPRSLVESLYAARVFPTLQMTLTSLSNLVPFALFDVLVVGIVGFWLFETGRDIAAARRAGWLRAAKRIATRTVIIGAGSYLAFLATWGLNYRRV